MTTDRDQILLWIEEERDAIVALLQRLVRARSPNPPGDTLAAAAVVRERLDAEALPYRIVDPNPVMPNFVGTFDGGRKGRHLVLNGHIDVFPVAGDHGWSGGTAEPLPNLIRAHREELRQASRGTNPASSQSA